jgi:hypothetical protein
MTTPFRSWPSRLVVFLDYSVRAGFFVLVLEWFLVTAEHVVADLYPPGARRFGAANDCDVLVPGPGDFLVRLSGKVVASPKYDVAALWLKDPSSVRDRWAPITVVELCPEESLETSWFHVAGWPVQIMRQDNRPIPGREV